MHHEPYAPNAPHAWQAAASVAAQAHRHQVRKDGCTPYAAHPSRVAMVIAVCFGCTDPDILAAAYLHDVLEDSTIDYDDLLEWHGRSVADFVAAMSKDHRMEEGPREIAYEKQLAEGPWQARLIKLADVYDNLSDAADPAAQRKFIDKAETALAMSKGDEQLAPACSELRALILMVQDALASSA